MAFINKDSIVVIEGKITNIGRQLLAYGSLTFNKFAVGDSEIDYQFLDKYTLFAQDQNVLRPIDSQPNMRYPVLLSNTSTDYLAPIPSVSANERLIRNKGKERGFFSRTLTSAPAVTPVVYTPYHVTTGMAKATTLVSNIGNSTTMTLASITGISVGNMLLVQWFPNSGGNPAPTDADNILAVIPRAWLWYQVLNIVGMTVVVDRPLPHFSGTIAGNVYVYPSLYHQTANFESGLSSPYWDTETLAFGNSFSSNTSDVPVWNLSIVYGKSVAGANSLQGANTYPSSSYEGIRTYLGTVDPSKAIGIVHYTNHSNNNYYGEGFFDDTLVIELPTVMYHNSATAVMGMTLTTDTTKRSLVSNTSTSTNFSLIYRNLLGPDQKVIGKVFNDLKIVVIENTEILAALSYASNRNWTLPQFTQFSISSSSNSPSTDSQIYVTYALNNSTGDLGNGYRNAMICQDWSVGYGTGISGVQFGFSGNDFKFLNSAANGTGFSATDLIILFQIVPPNALVEPDKWVPLNFNAKIGANSATGIPITPAMLSQQTWFISGADLTSATTAAQSGNAFYKIDYLSNTATPAVTFGSEQLFFGNLKTDIKAVTFATTFRFQLNVGGYDKSTNPTWNPTLPVYITEVGIYDNNDKLVVSGKLNFPLRKDSDEVVLISLDMDF